MSKISKEKYSYPEKTILYYLRELFPDIIESYKPSFLGQSEIDMYIPSINIGIEYDGCFWHSQKHDIDIEKNEKCIDNGIEIVRIREYGLPELPNKFTFYLLSDKKGSDLDKSIYFIVEYINKKNGFSKVVDVDFVRDCSNIYRFFSETKSRIKEYRWNEIKDFYLSEEYLEEKSKDAFFYYGIEYMDSVYSIWGVGYKFYITDTYESKNPKIISVEDFVLDYKDCKIGYNKTYILMSFQNGLFRFSNKVNVKKFLDIFFELHNTKDYGYFRLNLYQNIISKHKSPIWNICLNKIKGNQYSVKEDSVIYEVMSFNYKKKNYTIWLDFGKKSLHVENSGQENLHHLFYEIYDTNGKLNCALINMIYKSPLNKVYMIFYCLRSGAIYVENEETEEAFVNFVYPFLGFYESEFFVEKEWLVECDDISILEYAYEKKYDCRYDIFEKIAKHKDASSEMLNRICDEDVRGINKIRLMVINNPNVSKDTLEKLKKVRNNELKLLADEKINRLFEKCIFRLKTTTLPVVLGHLHAQNRPSLRT